MKLRTLLICTVAFIAQTFSAQTFETATEAVANMGIGWNLGNSLDSHKADVTDVLKTEILRGQIATKPELMTMLKDAGFGAVRVPVTWYPHMANDGTVDAAWMARVKEVVDYVLDAGMYCIINVHHDGNNKDYGSFPGHPWMQASPANAINNRSRFKYLWTQIANTFKDYDQRLIFEGYNELLDQYNSWNYASYNCENNYNAVAASEAYSAINSYAQYFVDAVRATGGNNAQRNLVVNTYAAACARGSWSKRLTEPLKEMQLPTDESPNHIIFGVHSYPRIADTDSLGVRSERSWADIDAELTTQFHNLTDTLAAKGAPVIISEWGSSNVDETVTDYDALRNHFLYFADDFVKRAKAAGIPVFYWMGVTDRADRSLPVFTQPDLAETMLKAHHGENYNPSTPSKDDYTDKVYNATYLAQWGEVLLASFEDGQGDYTKLTVEFAQRTTRGRIQLRAYYTGDDYVSTTIQSVTTAQRAFRTNGDKVTRVVLSYISTDLSFKPAIKRVYLTKSNGTTVDLVPKQYNNSYIELAGTPLFNNIAVSDALYTSLYYSDRNFIVPEGTTPRAYKVEDGQLVRVKTYEAGDVIPMATGVVIGADMAGTYMFRHTTEAGEAPVGSMLRGSDTEETTTGGDTYYMLSLNSNFDINSAGFYYKYDNGAPFLNDAHKAYLAVPAGQSLAPRYIFSEKEDAVATGINNAVKTPEKDPWYTIDGRKLNAAPTSSGIYIRNGKKIIIK